MHIGLRRFYEQQTRESIFGRTDLELVRIVAFDHPAQRRRSPSSRRLKTSESTMTCSHSSGIGPTVRRAALSDVDDFAPVREAAILPGGAPQPLKEASGNVAE